MFAHGKQLRLADFLFEGIASSVQANRPEPGGNSVGMLLSRCYGVNTRRRRFDTNLLILFEAVAWFFGFWAEHSFWARLKALLELASGNNHDGVRKVVVWYCECRKAFHYLHEQRHGKRAPSGDQAPSRIVEIIDQINSRETVVSSCYATDKALEDAWSVCAASWPAQLKAVLEHARSSSRPIVPALVKKVQPRPQFSLPTHSSTMDKSSAISVASALKTNTNSPQSIVASPVQKPQILPKYHQVIEDQSNTRNTRPKTLAAKEGVPHYSSQYDEPSDQIAAPKQSTTMATLTLKSEDEEEDNDSAAFTGYRRSLWSPEFTTLQPSGSTPDMAQTAYRSPEKGLFTVIDPALRTPFYSQDPSTVELKAPTQPIPGTRHTNPSLPRTACESLGLENRSGYSPTLKPHAIDSSTTDTEREKIDGSLHEYAQTRKRLVSFSDISIPRKKLRSTSIDAGITSKKTSPTGLVFRESRDKYGKIGLPNATALLDETNQFDLSFINATDQNHNLEDVNNSTDNMAPENTEFTKLKLDFATLLSSYQTKSAAIRVASQSDERIMQLECRVQRLDKIEGQLRALQEAADQIHAPGHAEKIRTISEDTTKHLESPPSAGNQHLQFLKSCEVKPFLSGISDEIAKLQAAIRHKIRQQEETDDGWKKMEHLADVLWILDEAFAKATKGAAAL